jgi:hypothetical protein
LIWIAIFAYSVYLIFIKDIQLVIDHNSIQIYSFNNDEASKEFLWSDIKSIQFGFMYIKGSRIEQHRMKITHKKNRKDDSAWGNTYLNVRKFANDQEIIQTLESIGEIKNIDVFHLDE